ncbi:PrsW family intramembrane metalloprotease [Brachybacterium sp. Marseille-Q7125]|uniref:PrsW family intramembrane metalloprotease n=1 Tax=Brachybacterium sp. Marseille-Q7125 TaxID=2932815 RepID=UPI001FF210AE|nr:PrsW family intramembrane metalloprotease [Brachybacterium sp. Marseille-Q7125]
MSHPPQQPHGQYMPNGRPRPGAPTHVPDAPAFQSQPRFRDYGNPRAYDTSVRPTSGLTAARFGPAQIQRPDQAQPQSAWATQTRRVQQVEQEATKAPTTSILVWIALVMLGFALLLVLGYFFLDFVVTASSSPIWWPVAAFLALMSLIVISLVMLLADRWDPQPIPLLIIAIFWGAAVSAFGSYWINTFNSLIVYAITGSEPITNFFGPVISAPLVEESTKGLGLLLLLILARRYFNGPLDGLIYGALIGGGFAFTENIIYYTRGFEGAGVGGLVFLVMLRGVGNIFGHAIYTSATGIIMGYVARKWGTIPTFIAFIPALIPGMLMHAAWNLSATILPGGLVSLLLMYGTKAVIALVWLIVIGLLVWDESRLTRVRLGDYANQGWLTHEEVNMLATWSGRREGRRWAAQIGAKPIMKRFIRESADLASIRQRLLADGANPKVVETERQLLGRLTSNRQQLLAHAR